MNCLTFLPILLQSIPCLSTEKLLQAEFSGLSGLTCNRSKQQKYSVPHILDHIIPLQN